MCRKAPVFVHGAYAFMAKRPPSGNMSTPRTMCTSELQSPYLKRQVQ